MPAADSVGGAAAGVDSADVDPVGANAEVGRHLGHGQVAAERAGRAVVEGDGQVVDDGHVGGCLRGVRHPTRRSGRAGGGTDDVAVDVEQPGRAGVVDEASAPPGGSTASSVSSSGTLRAEIVRSGRGAKSAGLGSPGWVVGGHD